MLHRGNLPREKKQSFSINENSTNMDGASVSDMSGSGASAPSSVSANNNNYISSLLATGKCLAQPACTKWNTLSGSQRTMAAIIGVPLLLLPLIWLLIISPWIIVGGLALYALLFGPRTMVAHLEGALREQLHVPNQVRTLTNCISIT